jgi:hypothetical protein
VEGKGMGLRSTRYSEVVGIEIQIWGDRSKGRNWEEEGSIRWGVGDEDRKGREEIRGKGERTVRMIYRED